MAIPAILLKTKASIMGLSPQATSAWTSTGNLLSAGRSVKNNPSGLDLWKTMRYIGMCHSPTTLKVQGLINLHFPQAPTRKKDSQKNRRGEKSPQYLSPVAQNVHPI
jgi:hypothetical protein